MADSLILDKITHSEYKKQWRTNNEDYVNDFWYSGNTKTRQKAEYENIKVYGRLEESEESIDLDDPRFWDLERYEGKRP